jgi:hypothetical protein
MEKRERTHPREVKSNFERIEALEEAMGITYEEIVPFQTRIRNIAQGIFESTEQFLEDNPEMPSQVKILYEQVFPTPEEHYDTQDEISKIKDEISDLRRNSHSPTFSGGGCTGSSSDYNRSRGC